jgi:hypothetical protein
MIIAFIIVIEVMKVSKARHWLCKVIHLLSFFTIINCADVHSVIVFDDCNSTVKYSLIKSSKFYHAREHQSEDDKVVNEKHLTNYFNDQLRHCVKPVIAWKGNEFNPRIMAYIKSIKTVNEQNNCTALRVNEAEISLPYLDQTGSNSSTVYAASFQYRSKIFNSSTFPNINDAETDKRHNLKTLQKSMKNPVLKDFMQHTNSSIGNSKKDAFRYFLDIILLPISIAYCIRDHHRKININNIRVI